MRDPGNEVAHDLELRIASISNNLVPRVFVPLDQRSEKNERALGATILK